MVVDILKVRTHLVGHKVKVAAEERVHHFAHRQDHPPKRYQALPERERTPLQGFLVGRGHEQLVLELFDLLVEGLYRLEVPVDELVEQSVQQEGDTMLRQVRERVPSGNHSVQIDALLLVHGNQCTGRDEGGNLVGGNRFRGRIEADSVSRQERVIGIVIELRPLTQFRGVFDGQLVQTQLLGE